jgi:DNA polymerase I-like protein with 3'-5' exonuclease and polymerase domains
MAGAPLSGVVMHTFDMSIPAGRWVENESEARQWVEYFLKTHELNNGLGLDSETSGLNLRQDQVIVWSIADMNNRICLPASLIPIFKEPILENPNINFDLTNAKFDAHMFANSGADISKAGEWRNTIVQSFLLNENNQGRHGLKECIVEHFGRTTPTFQEVFGKVPPKKIDKITGKNLNPTVGDLIRRAFTKPTPPNQGDFEYSEEGVRAYQAAVAAYEEALHKFQSAADYASLDAYNSHSLRLHFDELLAGIQIRSHYSAARNLMDYFYQTEVPFTKLLWKLERRGITVDRGHLLEQSGPMVKEMESIQREFNRYVGRMMNLNATEDIRWFFFDHLKKTPVKMTKGGASGIKKASTDFDTLDTWAGQGDEWAMKLLRYRSIKKTHGTYVEGLQEWLDTYYRIHTSLNQTGAVTMRLSSSEPNLQNIPRPSEDRFKIRDAFIHGPGMILIVADYEQLEMRLMAHFSGDEKMIGAIRDGKDLHCLTVAETYGIPYDEVMAAKKAEKQVNEGKRDAPLTEREIELLFYRQAAKATGFGIIYGIGGEHLAANLTQELKRLVTPEEGFQLIKKWFSVFPGAKAYIEKMKVDLWQYGYVETIVGRFRRFGALQGMAKKDAKAAERQAGNARIQGTASDIAKAAMLLCEYDPELISLGYRLLLQIHDELLGECPVENAAQVKARVKYLMENPFGPDLRLSVPLPASVGQGHTWATAK